MQRRHCLRLLAAAPLLATLPAHSQRGRPSQVLYVHGNALTVGRVITLAELRAWPAAEQKHFSQTRSGSGRDMNTTVRGVRLAALIDHVGLSDRAKANWKWLTVTATATDGYRAVMTWVELTNTPSGEAVLVVYERDGMPLDDREGAMSLQATGDYRLGARHVRNLIRVEVALLDA